MPAPWLTEVLPVMTVPVLMKTWPEPSSSTPPPASPAWLSLMVLLLMVSVQGVLSDVLHRDAAAVGGGDVVGDDHVGQRQADVALVADAAAGAGRPRRPARRCRW